jgi:hypothetical protein
MTVGITELPPEGMQLGGVALAGDVERGTKTTEGLSLLFTTAGITVQGPQPQIERLLVWSGLDSASCREKTILSDGRNAAVMELTSGGQSIRFLLPMDTVTPGQAAYLDQALPAWLSRYKASATTPPPPPSTSVQSTQSTQSAPITPPTPTAPTSNEPKPGVAAAGIGAASVATTSATNGSNRDAPDRRDGSETRDAPETHDAPETVAGSADRARPPAPGSEVPPPNPPVGPGAGSAAANLPGPAFAGPAFSETSGSGTSQAPPSPSSTESASSTQSTQPAPPPPPPPPVTRTGALPPAGTAGWEAAAAPPPATSGWNSPPIGAEPPVADMPPTTTPPTVPPPTDDLAAPTKKTRGWRKSRPPATAVPPPISAPVPPPGALAPLPPPEPPVDPTPLRLNTPLPPPQPANTTGPGPVVWKPPVDPATGAVVWDQVEAPPAAPPKKSRGWRKGAKGAAAAGGISAAALLAEPPGADTPAAGSPTTLTQPEPDAFAGLTPPAEPGGHGGATPKAPTPKVNRTLLWVLLAVVIVAIGAGTYFALKKNNNSTTTATTVVTNPTPSPAVADAALATSINLRLSDLPAGWSQTAGVGQVPTTSLAPASAQTRANQSLASCLGQPVDVVTGLFAGATLPGQTASVRSPSFQSGPDPNIQMFSDTRVFQTTGDAQSLAAPFAAGNFATCFGQYQSALVSAAIPGATAQVETVALQSPAGIRGFGYLTTLTVPNRGTQVVGEAFIVGGRMETLIQPSTNGPPVPSGPFGAAYNSVTGRMAAAVDK